jgi:hypothetical protein
LWISAFAESAYGTEGFVPRKIISHRSLKCLQIETLSFDSTKVGSSHKPMITVIVTSQHVSLSGGFSTVSAFFVDLNLHFLQKINP